LPGLEEKDIDVTLNDGILTLKGEKKHEADGRETNGSFYSERWHGRFERTLRLGADVDPNKVKASFKQGVLTISVEKRPEAQRQVKRITINRVD
jgi:HSP20 family protein